MLWVYDHYKYFYSYSAGIDFRRQNLTNINIFTRKECGDRLYTSESDVCRRQILTYKDGPRTVRAKGTCPVTKIQKPEKSSDWPDPTHPLP